MYFRYKTSFLNRGGFPEVAWKGGDGDAIFFRLTIDQELDQNAPPKIFEYEISIVGSQSGLLSIEREHLIVKREGRTSTLINLKNGRGEITHEDGGIAFTFEDPTRSALEFSVPDGKGWNLNL